MPEYISHEMEQVIRDLVIAAIVYRVWKFARESALDRGTFGALWRGWAWSFAFAAFVGISLGEASCSSSDPLRGGCEEYAEDGYPATWEQKFGKFIYWALLFGIPVTIAAMDVPPRPKRPSD
ncbi:MAG: hypothetical protein U1E64_14630 [Sphingomonadaceae bacterium]